MNFTAIEREIISAPQTRLYELREMLQGQIAKLDYFMSQFMEKYGKHLDEERNDKYHSFYRDTTNEYNKVNRLLRVIHAYDNK